MDPTFYYTGDLSYVADEGAVGAADPLGDISEKAGMGSVRMMLTPGQLNDAAESINELNRNIE